MTGELRAIPGDVRRASVGLDMAPNVPGWYVDTDRWNGFINPWVSRESVNLINDWYINECGREWITEATWDGDTLILTDNQYPEEPPTRVEPQRAPDGSQVYAYLHGGYTWGTARMPAEGDIITFLGEFPGDAEVLDVTTTEITWGDGVANVWTESHDVFTNLSWIIKD